MNSNIQIRPGVLWITADGMLCTIDPNLGKDYVMDKMPRGWGITRERAKKIMQYLPGFPYVRLRDNHGKCELLVMPRTSKPWPQTPVWNTALLDFAACDAHDAYKIVMWMGGSL